MIALWIPLLPLLAALVLTLVRTKTRTAVAVAVAGQIGAFALALVLFARTVGGAVPAAGDGIEWLSGFRFTLLADPLSTATALMVAFVSLLVFVYSAGYMAGDPRAPRFFAFLSLFASAMLGLVLAGDLLLLFICWELVGLASYLLIGFWFEKPAAAAAARKAFLTTRIGDLGLLAGMLWLHRVTGTLRFYEGGSGCLESAGIAAVVAQPLVGGMAASAVIALLLFLGAAGKSGQFPLHVWLPDAMEGPTPVSALIHAATMVAAGVFLVARMFPLFAAEGPGGAALVAVAWVGAFTAVFAALIAVAQYDIKRILAYSTVSQLGFMMLALGVAGPAVAMVHLIAHAFFKALLFLGAGSVIHGMHGEQDIRRMGGLRAAMPATFAAYAVGMMALAGVPVLFTGFWSKDAILHAAHGWAPSHGPFVLGCIGAALTAFYMTRQIRLVFFAGPARSTGAPAHESPAVMLVPLFVLATVSVVLSAALTPAWPWLEAWIAGHAAHWEFDRLVAPDFVRIAALSCALVIAGIGAGWVLYRRGFTLAEHDPLARAWPAAHAALERRLFIDEIYRATVLRWARGLARVFAGIDRWVWNGLVMAVSAMVRAFSRLSEGIDEAGINDGADRGAEQLRASGRDIGRGAGGNVQNYLRVAALGVALVVFFILWIR
jgi:NADH-quinone oxidoreductase subunit L